MVERMWHLYQFPLCPFSRKVRFLMAEKGIIYELVRESPWEARDEFLDLNPAGMTPVLVADDSAATLVDSQAICEYFEETIEHFPLISGSTLARAEIRRLVAWFDQIVYRDVVAPLLNERMIKRIVSRAAKLMQAIFHSVCAGIPALRVAEHFHSRRAPFTETFFVSRRCELAARVRMVTLEATTHRQFTLPPSKAARRHANISKVRVFKRPQLSLREVREMTNLVLLNSQRSKKDEQERADLVNGLKELLAKAELGELKAVCYASIATDNESITLGILKGGSTGLHEMVGASQILADALLESARN